MTPGGNVLKTTGGALGGIGLATAAVPFTLGSILLPLGIGAGIAAGGTGLFFLAKWGLNKLKDKRAKKKIDAYVASVAKAYSETHMKMLTYEMETKDEQAKRDENLKKYRAQLTAIKNLLNAKPSGKKYTILNLQTKQPLLINQREKSILDIYKMGFDIAVFETEMANMTAYSKSKELSDEQKKKLEAQTALVKQNEDAAKAALKTKNEEAKKQSHDKNIEKLKTLGLVVNKKYKISADKVASSNLDDKIKAILTSDKTQSVTILDKDGVISIKLCTGETDCKTASNLSLETLSKIVNLEEPKTEVKVEQPKPAEEVKAPVKKKSVPKSTSKASKKDIAAAKAANAEIAAKKQDKTKTKIETFK
jgi:hypothetical protein